MLSNKFPPPPSAHVNKVPDKPAFTFWEMMDEAVVTTSFDRDILKPYSSNYPSSASIEILNKDGTTTILGSCNRKEYWRRTKEPPTNPASVSSTWNMEMGNWVSDMIVEWTKRRRVYVAHEVPFIYERYNISGRVDLFYLHPVTKRVIGAEIKSVGGYGPSKGVVTGYPLAPKAPHVLQTAIYLDFFKQNFDVDIFDIIYYSRENGDRSVFTCTLDESVGEVLIDGVPSGIKPSDIYKRFEALEIQVRTGTLPARDFELQYSSEKLLQLANSGNLTKKQAADVTAGRKLVKGDSQCSWCVFKEKCWKRSGAPRD